MTTASTVKVTIGHGTQYSKIKHELGLAAATNYAHANIAGMELIRSLVRSLDVDCAFEDGQPHVIYAERPADASQLEEETQVATVCSDDDTSLLRHRRGASR